MRKHAFPDTPPRLQNGQITLRRMHEGDATALFAIYGDPSVMRYTDETPFDSLATVACMLQSVHRLFMAGQSLEWGVVLEGSDTVIGTCGLHGFDDAFNTAEVGCLLLPSAWGNGYMPQAVGLLAMYARDVLGLGNLVADVHNDNQRAQRMFAKLGFQRDAPGLWSIALNAVHPDRS